MDKDRSNFERISELAQDGTLRCRIPADPSALAPSVDRAPASDRIAGMLLGVAVGDALGSITEGMKPAAASEDRPMIPNSPSGLPNQFLNTVASIRMTS